MRSSVRVLVGLSLVTLCACGGASPRDPAAASAPAEQSKPKKLCADRFVNADQFAQVSNEVKPYRDAPIELRTLALIQSLEPKIGRQNSVGLLRSGLLSDWLVQLVQSPPVLDPSKLCKTAPGAHP